MITDSLTMATVIVSIFVVVIIFISIYYSHVTTNRNMRVLAQRTIMLSTDKEIRDLCKKIMELDPRSCPLLDNELHRVVVHEPETLKKLLRHQLEQLGGSVNA